jgi:protein SCO1
MKPKFTLAALCGITLLGVTAATIYPLAHSQPGSVATHARIFHVVGQVRGLDPSSRTIRIAHEAIPGYMPAMTMPLQVRERALLNALRAGDRVRFELRVTKDDSWIAQIEKLSDPESTEVSVSSGNQAPAGENDRVQIGETLPDFALTDQNGKSVHLRDYQGKTVVLTFIYTRCPLPNFCPLMSKNFQSLQERLEKTCHGRYQLLSISIDPRFDRPSVLKEYAARYRADEKHWTFATGSEQQIDSVAGLFGLFHESEGGLINHDLRTALIAPDGRLVHLWKSNVWTPYEVERMVRECVTNSNEFASRSSLVR